jgi:uncharacterized protein
VNGEMAEPETQLGSWLHRPLQNVDPDLGEFWEGLKQHEFRLCRCTRCGSWWFPYTVCSEHDDIPDLDEMEWVPSSGRGTIFARLVVHQVWDEAFADEVPYVLAAVELEEGPLFPARLVDCQPDDVSIGSSVEVTYLDSAEAGHTLPLFRLTA